VSRAVESDPSCCSIIVVIQGFNPLILRRNAWRTVARLKYIKPHGEVTYYLRAFSLAERMRSFRLTITVYRCRSSLPASSSQLSLSIFVSRIAVIARNTTAHVERPKTAVILPNRSPRPYRCTCELLPAVSTTERASYSLRLGVPSE
jgi:hypothetical protein